MRRALLWLHWGAALALLAALAAQLAAYPNGVALPALGLLVLSGLLLLALAPSLLEQRWMLLKLPLAMGAGGMAVLATQPATVLGFALAAGALAVGRPRLGR